MTAPSALPTSPPPSSTTLGALRDAGHRSRTVKQELRDNLLAAHDLVLLGERRQGKTRLMRTLATLLDDWLPVVEGCEINDDPCAPVCSRCRQLAAELGDDLPVGWLPRDRRYVEKL